MKYDLKDTTIIIPVRIDSIVRLENLLLTVDNLISNFDTNIIVVEASYYNNNIIKHLLVPSVSYLFIEDKDPIFHRTKHLNTISREIKTDILGIWDADIILDSLQIFEAVSQLRSGKYDCAYPYNGRFLDTSEILRNYYLLHKDINFFKNNIQKMSSLYSSVKEGNALGGAFLISNEHYRYSGSENEFFYGWGAEDGERYYRWSIFNHRIYRSEGVLFHLSHPRDHNGMIRSNYHEIKIMNEYNKIRNSTKEEIIDKFHNQKKFGNG